MNDNELLRVGEAAKVLKVSVSTLNRLIADGKIDFFDFSHGEKYKRIRILSGDLFDFMERRRYGTGSMPRKGSRNGSC